MPLILFSASLCNTFLQNLPSLSGKAWANILLFSAKSCTILMCKYLAGGSEQAMAVLEVNAESVFLDRHESHYRFHTHIDSAQYPQVHDFYEFTLMAAGTMEKNRCIKQSELPCASFLFREEIRRLWYLRMRMEVMTMRNTHSIR